MKIRTGFVSNSSSSSFCIYGTYVDTDDLLKSLIDNGVIDPEGKNFKGRWTKEAIKEAFEVFNNDNDNRKLYNNLRDLLHELNPIPTTSLTVEVTAENGTVAVGLLPEAFTREDSADIPAGDIIFAAQKELEKLFSKEVKLEWLEEAWHD